MFCDSSAIHTLKALTRQRVNDPAFESKWQDVLAKFLEWETRVARLTSELNIRLEFLQRICAVFPQVPLHRDKAIADILLADSGARDVGHTFKCQFPDRRTEPTTIINREITDRFGILYTVETAERFRFTKEFFD
jgi:hypothetical protein